MITIVRGSTDSITFFLVWSVAVALAVFLAFPLKCGGTFLREVLARCLNRVNPGPDA